MQNYERLTVNMVVRMMSPNHSKMFEMQITVKAKQCICDLITIVL